jgi:flagellar L-ring protein FlgH
MSSLAQSTLLRGMIALGLAVGLGSPAQATKKPKKSAEDLRSDYLTKIAQIYVAPLPDRSPGSIWSATGPLVDPGTDYKARTLNDTLTVLVSVQTTAAQSGSVNNSRDFSTSSAITGLLGGLSTTGTNPLFAAQSSHALKGQGQTSSNTTFSTSLTGQVIAVLPNGNLVVEAHRLIDMNNQHEEVIVRGLARPGDIAPNNTVPSTALSNLEIELKGKGIISDSVRPPNPITRAILWLFGF